MSARPTTALGEQAGQIAKEAMPNGAKCMGFVGHLDAANYTERRDGFNEGVAGHPDHPRRHQVGRRRPDRRQEERRRRARRQPGHQLHGRLLLVQHARPSTRRSRTPASSARSPSSRSTMIRSPSAVSRKARIAGTVVQQPFEWAHQGFQLMAKYLEGDKSGIPADGVIIIPGRSCMPPTSTPTPPI